VKATTMATKQKPGTPKKIVPIKAALQIDARRQCPQESLRLRCETGFKATIESLQEEIRELYLADDIPWISWILRRQRLDRNPPANLESDSRDTGRQTERNQYM
jgi:hypothetical protein